MALHDDIFALEILVRGPAHPVLMFQAFLAPVGWALMIGFKAVPVIFSNLQERKETRRVCGSAADNSVRCRRGRT